MNYSLQIICSFFPEHIAHHIIAITHSSHNVGYIILFYLLSFPFSLIFFLHYHVVWLKYPFRTKFQIGFVWNIIATLFQCPKQLFKLKRSDSHHDLMEKDVTEVIISGCIHCEGKEWRWNSTNSPKMETAVNWYNTITSLHTFKNSNKTAKTKLYEAIWFYTIWWQVCNSSIGGGKGKPTNFTHAYIINDFCKCF